MKLIEPKDVPLEVLQQLGEKMLIPVVWISEKGERVTAYLIDEEGLYWGVKGLPPATEKKI